MKSELDVRLHRKKLGPFDIVTQYQCRVMLCAGLSRRRRLRVVCCIVLLLPTLISDIYSVWPPGPVSPESLPLNQPEVNSH